MVAPWPSGPLLVETGPNLSGALKWARLTQMRAFRLMLTLLLCLTVPVAGWASVLSGPLCPRGDQASSKVPNHDHAVYAADEVVALHADAGEHHHSQQHCDDQATAGEPCKGDHCGCGCGMGACTASALSLTAPFVSLLIYVGHQDLSAANDVPHAGARSTSPLRPPIA